MWDCKAEQAVMSSLEKNSSDPGPLGTVPEEDGSERSLYQERHVQGLDGEAQRKCESQVACVGTG